MTVISAIDDADRNNLLEAITWCLYDEDLKVDGLLNSEVSDKMLNNSKEQLLVEIIFLHNGHEFILRKEQLFTKNEHGDIEASVPKMDIIDTEASGEAVTANEIAANCVLLDSSTLSKEVKKPIVILDNPFRKMNEQEIEDLSLLVADLADQVILILNYSDSKKVLVNLKNKIGYTYQIDAVNSKGTHSKIRKYRNNLFKFATSELSQDALIAWMFDNFHFKLDNKALYNLSIEMVRTFLGDANLSNIDTVRVIQQYKNIDVLVVVNEKYGIIIEDKIFASERKDQLYDYKKILIDNEVLDYEGLPKFESKNIRTVYFKTGFHYPLDQSVEADYKMTGLEFYHVLTPYEGESEILDDYIIKLKADLDWYRNIELMYEQSDTDALAHYYGQYLLLEDMFEKLESFSHGSSRGRPWSNHNIAKVEYRELSDKESVNNTFHIFCRIDKRRDSYYASIRQYDRQMDKKDSDMVERKRTSFNKLRQLFEETCESIGDLTSDTGEKRYKPGGNNGGYYESEFGVFFFGDETNQVTMKEFPNIFQEFLEIFTHKLKEEFTIIKE